MIEKSSESSSEGGEVGDVAFKAETAAGEEEEKEKEESITMWSDREGIGVKRVEGRIEDESEETVRDFEREAAEIRSEGVDDEIREKVRRSEIFMN